jgi:hypothetical protein
MTAETTFSAPAENTEKYFTFLKSKTKVVHSGGSVLQRVQ